MEKKDKKIWLILLVIFAVVLRVSTVVKSSYTRRHQNYTTTKKVETVTISTNYTKEDIINMFSTSSEQYSIDKINDDNIQYFCELLNYVDKIAGKGNYYIYSIYPVNFNTYKKYTNYVVLIIPNEYLDKHDNWSGNDATNPYRVMFANSYPKGYNNFYYSFLFAMEFQKNIIEELNAVSSEFEYLVQYNALLHVSSNDLGLDENSTLEKALAAKKRTGSELPQMYVVGDSSKSLDEIKQFIRDNESIFKKYYVSKVTAIQLKKNTKIENYDTFSKYDDIVNSIDTIHPL